MDVVGVGLNATDTVIPVSEFPYSGAKVEFRSRTRMLGGQVASAMIACRSWGLTTRYIGKLGDDDAAELHRAEFARADVETRLLRAEGCESQSSFILIEDSGERTVLWRRDDRLTIRPEELERGWITDARALHLDGHDTAAAIRAAGWAREAGIPVVADLDKSYEGVEELLPLVDYLISSRNLPGDLTGCADLSQALIETYRRYGGRLTAATLGDEGVLAWDGARYFYAPAYRVPVVDTTGAGDTFHAGFLFGMLQGWPMQHTLEFGCAAAALNCMDLGARGGVHPVEEIEALIANGERYPVSYVTSNLAISI